MDVQVLSPQDFLGEVDRAAWDHATSSRPTILDLSDLDWDMAHVVASACSRWGGLVIGSSHSIIPAEGTALLDAMTTTLAPGGPGRSWVDGDLSAVVATVGASPVAATVLGQVLASSRQLDAAYDALVVESLAYSMLLNGPEFRSWRDGTARHVDGGGTSQRVAVDRHGGELRVVLDRPGRRNAVDSLMREALLDALAVAEHDASVQTVRIEGAGPDFCSGGDLDEFGTAMDLTGAHLLRVSRSVGHAVHRLEERTTVMLHGACIGAGIEIPAFAATVLAHEDTWTRLPELSMGLIPGAGGTVSISRRIGPHRTAYLALSGARIGVTEALEWGLVDGLA